MDAQRLEQDTSMLTPLLGDLFLIDAVYAHNDRLVVSLSSRLDRSRALRIARERLTLAGYTYTFSERDEGPIVLSLDPRRRLRVPPLNLILFIATLFSVYVVPVFIENMATTFVYPSAGAETGLWNGLRVFATVNLPVYMEATLRDLRNGAGLQFTLAIMSILFVHEMGHFIASRRRHIVTSWPYFIPAPNIIGTFGAIIKSKSPFWNRRDLLEVGAAGPIAGWIVAIGWLVYGLTQSVVVPEHVQLGIRSFSLEGESILMRLLVPALIGPIPPGHSYLLTEGAFAGWVGMLVTAINMLPIGQLDGGHIMYGLIRERQRMFGWMATTVLLALGFHSAVWWVFAAFGLVFGVAHPPTIDDRRQPSRTALVLGIIALVVLILSFTPVPFRTR